LLILAHRLQPVEGKKTPDKKPMIMKNNFPSDFFKHGDQGLLSNRLKKISSNEESVMPKKPILKIKLNDKPISLKRNISSESTLDAHNISTSGSYNKYINKYNEDVFRFDNIDQLKQTACFSPINEKVEKPKIKFTEKSPKLENKTPTNSKRSYSLREEAKLPPVSCRMPLKLNQEVDSIINIASQYREDTELQNKIDLLVKNIMDIKNVLRTKGRDVKSAPKGRSVSIRK
jgi:hypothetical protein